MLDQMLRRFHPFTDLDWASVATLARHARVVRLAARRHLDARTAGRGRYYLCSGTVRWIDADGGATEIVADTAGARTALLGEHARGRVETLTPCTLLWVDCEPIAFLFESPTVAGYRVGYLRDADSVADWRERFLQRGLGTLAPRHLKSLFDSLQPRPVAAGERVFREGESGRDCFVIASGDAVVSRRGRELASLRAGDTFGEDALIVGCERNATVRMRTDGRLMVLPEAAFIAHLALPLVRWVNAAETGSVRVDADPAKDPRALFADRRKDASRIVVGGERRLRALWTFLAARRGFVVAALADPDQAGTVRPDAHLRRLSIASDLSTDNG